MAERMIKLLQCIPIFLCILGGRERFSDLLLLMFHFVSTLSREGGINIFPEKKKKGELDIELNHTRVQRERRRKTMVTDTRILIFPSLGL